ncbi:MAG: hypothetical protein ACOYBO_01135 [Azonexus sp.]|jgi:hypothetical protein
MNDNEQKGRKTFGAVSVAATATKILSGNAKRITLTLRNVGSADVYLGKDATVTTANGLLLKPTETLTDDNSTDAWWGIVASTASDIRLMEVA